MRAQAGPDISQPANMHHMYVSTRERGGGTQNTSTHALPMCILGCATALAPRMQAHYRHVHSAHGHKAKLSN